MLRHVVCLTFRADTPDTAVDELVAAMRALPAAVPEIRHFEVGTDLGLVDGNAHLAIFAEFDDADGWRAYQEHPEHVRVITELMRPIVAGRTAAQFDV
jgi:hypothetical protein